MTDNPTNTGIADAVHQIRPEWHKAGIESILRDQRLAKIPAAVILREFTGIARNHLIHSPAAIFVQPAINGTETPTLRSMNEKQAGIPVRDLCWICSQGPHARTDHEWTIRPNPADPETARRMATQIRTGIRERRTG
jgi:hypothetical protein